MRFSISQLGILLYVVPALSFFFIGPILGYEYSHAGGGAIFCSAAAVVFGYLASFLFRPPVKQSVRMPYKSYLVYSKLILMLGLACAILNMVRVGEIPLFSGNQNQVRAELQGSFLWNVYIFCSIGIFIFSTSQLKRNPGRIGWVLICTYIILALLSGWKGVFLNFIFLFLVPRYKNIRIPVSAVLRFSLFFFAVFFIVNGIRSGGFISALAQPVYYIYWGFVNFDIYAVPADSSCLHSVPFFGCKFEVDNAELVDPTWNVYTSLAPLYIDGGALLVSVVFFVFGFFSGYFERREGRLLYGFLCYVSFYFLFFSHNGYLFYSSFYILSSILVIILDYASRNFRKQVGIG